ncbi:MAG TPA: putative S-layer protein [Nanoarchaeota archaeon]|nr:putative S-layer protein [Nanoarchaeota archaeon]
MKKLLLLLIFVLVFSYTASAALTVNTADISGVEAGSDLLLSITVGSTAETFQNVDVRATIQGTAAVVTGSVSNVAPNSAQTASLTLSVPSDITPGTHTVTVTATDRANAANTVNTQKGFNVLPRTTVEVSQNSAVIPTLALKAVPGDLQTISYTLKNTGNVELSNIRLSTEFSSLEDNDDNLIRLTFTPSTIASLAPGASRSFTVQMDVDSSYEIKDLSGSLVISANIPNGVADLRVPISISILPSACSSSSRDNNIQLDITNPDDDEELEPGEEFTAVINVDNRDSDDQRITVEAVLYNTEKDKRVTKQSKTIKVDGKEDEDFTFDFTVPVDTDDDDSYSIFVKAYQKDDEDINCVNDDVSIDVEVPEHKLVIESFTFSPTNAVCGESVYGTVALRNLGASDERVTLSVVNDQLKISQTSGTITVDEDRNKNFQTATFSFTVPANAKQGTYNIEARANYGGLVKAQSPLTVTCGAVQETTGTSTQPTAVANEPGTTDYTPDESIFDKFNSLEVPLSVWVMLNVLLGVLVIVAIVSLFRRR